MIPVCDTLKYRPCERTVRLQHYVFLTDCVISSIFTKKEEALSVLTSFSDELLNPMNSVMIGLISTFSTSADFVLLVNYLICDVKTYNRWRY